MNRTAVALFITLILSAFSLASCTKNSQPATAISVTAIGDTTWHSTNVRIEWLNAFDLCIYSGSGPNVVSLCLNYYRAGTGTYPIAITATLNPNSNNSSFQLGNYSSTFSSGEIVITSYTPPTMQGTFALQGPSVSITGSFTAPTP